MSEAIVNPGRYRRRILGWGLLVLVLAFVIPAFFIVRWVQDDLENRVPAALSDAGIVGVSADFSGQDGTLSCEAGLDDPAAAIEIAEDVYGVRQIDLDDSCGASGNGSSGGDATGGTSPDDGVDDDGVDDGENGDSTATATTTTAIDEPTPTDPPVTDPPTTTAPTTEAPPATDPTGETISQITAQDPQFGQLSSLLEQTGLAETLDGPGPFTLLAPTDAAFDATFEAVGADAFEALISDPERLRDVLLHHATDGLLRSTDFEAGPLEMLDGTTIEVDPDADGGVVFTSGETVGVAADPAQIDIDASNGVVHAIDQVLLPADFVIDVAIDEVVTSADLENGQITLGGTVQTDEQRVALVAAAQASVAEGNVVDQVVVDADSVVLDGDIERLGRLVGAMPVNLVSGTATLSNGALQLVGVHTGEEQNVVISALADELAADIDVQAREGADDDAAQALQDELNDFVRENPILFEPNSAELTPDADAVVEQVAARAQRFEGVAITIIGHTDSDGDDAFNQTLSEDRADTVLGELVAAGISASTLSAEGRGETIPVLDDAGNEDKAASRRVEFVVRAQS